MRPHAVTASGATQITKVNGWQFTENAGTPAAARVLLREGSGGTIVADIRLAASESVGETYPEPLELMSGCYVEVSSGSVRGAVYGQ